MTTAAPHPTPTLQGLSRAEAMSLRPTRLRRIGHALEIQVSNGQILRMEGYYQPEVKALSEQAKAKSRAATTQDASVRGKQLRKAQELLEKAQGLADGQTLQDPAGLNEAGTLRNYWQVWQQWQSEALGLPETAPASEPAPASLCPAPSAARDGAMSVLPAAKTPVGALEASGLGLGYVAAPVVGLAALAGGGGGGSAGAAGLSFTSPALAMVKENQLLAAKVTASNSGATFSLDSTSPDAAFFNLNTSTGQLSFKTAPDFEATPAKTSYTLKINASVPVISGGALVTQTASQTLTLQLEDVVNEDTLVLSLNGTLGSGNTQLTQAEARTPNLIIVSGLTAGNTLTVVLTGTQGSVTRTLTDTAAGGSVGLSLTDADLAQLGDGTVSVVATSTDAKGHVSLPSNGNRTGANALGFSLDTVAPAITTAATYSVTENTTLVGTLGVAPVKDVADSVTWALVTDTSTATLTAASTDSGLFTIASGTGVLSFTTAPDFEKPGDADRQGTYHLRVSATDAAGHVTYQNITVALNDVAIEQAPVLAFGNQINALGGLTRAEALGYTDPAGQVFGVVTATGVPAGHTLLVTFDRRNGTRETVTLTGPGSLSDKLQVSLSAEQWARLGDGQIWVSAISQDARGNASPVSNVLDFTLDTVAPAFASSSTTLSVAENTLTVGTLATQTVESVTWRLSTDNDPANADAALFNIAANGVLTFKSAPDFENPLNASQSNAYRVRVIATDSAGNAATQDVVVQVTDVAEAIRLSNVPANNPYVQAGVASDLPDLRLQSVPDGGATVQLSATGGTLSLPDSLRFTLGAVVFSDNNTSLRLYDTSVSKLNAALAGLMFTSDLAATALGLTYAVWPGTVSQSGDPVATQSLTLQTTTLTAPVITPLQRQYRSSNLLVSSQALAQQLIDNHDLSNPQVFAALAGQYNADSTRTQGGDLGWSLPGQFVEPYSRVMVGLNKSQVSVVPVQSQFGWHLIQLTDWRDLPATTGDNGAGINLRVAENTPAPQALISYGANEPVAWTLSGPDAARFAIDASGALTFRVSPDFEAPQDVDADNTYQLQVLATSTATGLSTLRPITVTVTNVASGGTLAMAGNATEGQALTAQLTLPTAPTGDPFDADAANPVSTTWRWQQKGSDGLWVDLYGANSNTYTVPVDGSMLGAQVRVAATATDRSGATLQWVSAAQTVADNGAAPPAVSYPVAQLLSATGAQNGWLNAGDVITASVNFNQAVKVYGSPQLILYIGGGNGTATYDSANSIEATGLLRFTYTLKASDASDPNGIAVGYFNLNGATLYGAQNNTLNPSVSASDNPLFKVDNTPPAAPTLSYSDSGSGTFAAAAEASQGFLKISGAESGATVRVTLVRSPGASLVKTFTGLFGDQLIPLSPTDIAALGNGSITASAVVIDAAGNSTPASTTPAGTTLGFTLDTLAPTFLSPQSLYSPENQTAIGQLRASETVTWSLLDAGGNPATLADVALNTSTGVLTWKNPAGLDFEDSAVSTTRTFSVRATDAAGNSSTQSITVRLTPVNEAPVISASTSSAQGLTASDSSASTFGVGAFAGVMVSDPDATASFTPTLYATLSAPAGTLSGITDADGSRPGLQFSGSPAQLQAQLAALSWTDAPAGDASRAGPAAITLRVSDIGYADTLAASSTSAVLVSRLPTLALGAGAAPAYTENAASGTPIAPSLSLGHASTSTPLASGQLRLGMSQVVIDLTGGVSGDTLTLDPAARALGFSLTPQPFNAPVTIATPQWVLKDAGNATLARWQAALRGITYSSTSEDPGVSTARGITIKVIDAWGGTAQVSQSLSVTSVPDAPTFTGIQAPTPSQALMVETAVPHDWAVHFSNSAGVTQSVTPTVTDLDSPLVHLSITPSAQITLNPATASQISGMTAVTLAGSVLQMSGTPEALTRALGVITFTANAIGSGQLDVRISDVSLTDAATRAPQSIHIQAQAAADRTPPTLGLNATSLETPENQTLISATLPGLFRPSEGVVWSFDASGVDNSRFNLNPLTGEISWKVAPDFETASQTLITEGPYSGDKRFNLAFKAIDLSGNVSQPLSLGVHLQDVNEAPQRVTSAGTPAGTEHRWATLAQLGNLYSLDLSTLFQDPDAGDALTYSASIPVGWLSLAANGRLTASGSLPATDTRVDFEVTATDRLGLSATVPISLHAVAQSAPQVIGLNVKDNAGDAWVGNASQTLTLNVLFNTADLRVTGNPTATVVIAGAAYTAFFTGATTAWSTQQGAAQGVLSFALSVPSGVNTEGVTLTGIQNALGSSIVNPSNGAALDTSTTYAFSAPYVVDHTAPARPVVQLASGLSQTGVSASALASHPGGVLDVVTEPGASLSVLFSNANEPNQRVSKTLDTALLGLNPIALTPNEATQLGVGSINAQIIAIDPAGNRSDPAWFNLTVI